MNKKIFLASDHGGFSLKEFIKKHLIKNKINKFIEIGPGKVLSGLIKRIDRNVKVTSINTEDDIKQIKLND